ncbi:MAG TPA: hypothetical protein VEF04_09425 [Blastocatellia bacterium]|nr:hypothetical protein [Blastocatellia bacterium]
MAAKVNKEFQATVLVEALFTTDQKVCEKYGVSERSLRRWRNAFAFGTDQELAACVHTKKEAFDREWVAHCNPALAAGINFLTDAARFAGDQQKKNPQFIAAIAGAVKVISEVKLTSDIIGARIRQMNSGETDEQAEQVFGQPVASRLKQ